MVDLSELVPDQISNESFRFERRLTRRHPAAGQMMAAMSDGAGGVVLTAVDLHDLSDVGLGLRSPMFIEPGVTVALYPMGGRASSCVGVVTHCRVDRRDEELWDVGIDVGHRLAA